MSRNIDEQVTRVTLDNSNFERNAQQTIKTSQQLESALQFKEGSSGLEKVSKAAKNVDMQTLEKNVGAVSKAFSSLEVIGFTALQRITNAAIDAGSALVKSLSTDNMAEGFSKYESKVASVQTIMNATGRTADQVNDVLNKLMTFSDETSFGFADMTQSLSQMVTVGGDIDKLVPMITGIANATAFAGKGSSEFQRAIYNLTQSYGAGYLQLMDWKSVQLAGVNSQQLTQTLIDTAVELGKVNEGVLTLGNFSENLKNKWIDTEVMEVAFGKFGAMYEKAYEMLQAGEVETITEAYSILADQFDEVTSKATLAAQEAKTFTEAIEATKDAVSSGWMATFEIIFGTYEEAKELWTNLTEVLWNLFAAGASSRNELLQGWKDLGGRNLAIGAFYNLLTAILNIINPIKAAWRDVFPPATSERLVEITKGIYDFTNKLILSDESMANLRATFRGLFSILGLGVDAFKAVFGWVKKLLGIFPSGGSFVDNILRVTGSLGDFITGLREVIKSGGSAIDVLNYIQTGFTNFGVKLEAVLKNIKAALSGFELTIGGTTIKPFEALADVLTQAWNGLKDLYNRFFKGNPLEAIKNMLQNGMEGIRDVLSNIKNLQFVNVFDLLAKGLQTIFNTIKSLVSGFKGFEINWEQLFAVAAMVVIIVVIGKLLNTLVSFSSALTEMIQSFKRVGDALATAIRNIGNSLTGLINAAKLNIQVNALWTLAKSLAVLGGTVALLTQFRWEQLAIAVVALVALGGILVGITIALSKFPVQNLGAAAATMISMSIAILILATTMKSFVGIDLEDIATGIIAVVGGIAVMAAAIFAMSLGVGNILKVAAALIALSTAMIVLTGAIRLLGGMDTDILSQGLKAVAEGLLILVAATKILQLGGMAQSAKLLSGFGISMLSLAAAVLIFGNMNPATIFQGMSVITLALLELALATKLVGKANIKGAATTILALAASMSLLAVAVLLFGSMNLDVMIQGGLGVSAMLIALSAAARIAASTADNGTFKTILTLAAGILAIYAAVVLFGSLDLETLIKGGVAVILSLAAMTAALKLMANDTKALDLAAMGLMVAAILAVAGAVVIMADVLKQDIGVEKWGALSASIVSMGALIKILSKIPFMEGIQAVGILVVFLAAMGLMVGILGGLATQFEWIEEFLDKGGEIMEKIGAAIGKLVGGLIGGIAAGVIDVVGESLAAFFSLLPQMGQDLGAFATNASPFIDMLKTITPEDLAGVDILANIILKLTAANILDVLTRWIPGNRGIAGFAEDIQALGEGVVAFAEKIRGIDQSDVAKGSLCVAMIATAYDMIEGNYGIKQFFTGFNDVSGFVKALPALGEAVATFADSVSSINGTKTKNAAEALEAMTAAYQALPNQGGIVSDVAGALLGEKVDPKEFGESMAALGKSLMSFTENIEDIDDKDVETAKNIMEVIIALAKGIPNTGGLWGMIVGNNDLGPFADQLPAFGTHLKDFTDNVHGVSKEDIDTAEYVMKIIIALAKEIPNTGGIWGDLVGNNDIGDFGDQLPNFGTHIKDFTDNIDGISLENVDSVDYLMDIIIAMAKSIPNTGGLWGMIVGNNDLDDFGEMLVTFGSYMVDFTDEIGKADTSSIRKAQIVAEGALNVTNLLTNYDKVKTLGEIGVALATFGQGVNYSYNYISEVDTDEFLKVITIAKKLTIEFGNMATAGVENMEPFVAVLRYLSSGAVEEFLNAFSNADASVEAAIGDFFKDVRSNISAGIYQLLVYLPVQLAKITDAIEATSTPAAKAVQKVIEDALNAAAEKRSNFVATGQYLMLGLVEGLNTQDPNRLGGDLAKKLIEGFENEAGIASPSVVMKEEGVWLVKGLADGITTDTSAEEAMTKKAENLVSAFETAINSVELRAKTPELEYNLWEALFPDATESQKQQAQAELLRRQIEDQNSLVELAAVRAKAANQEFGQDSEEFLEAYQNYLTTFTELKQLENELADLFKVEEPEPMEYTGDPLVEAWKAYYDLITEYRKTDWESFGIAWEDIEAMARREAGLDELLAETQEEVDEVFEGVGFYISDALSEIYDSVTVETEYIVTEAVEEGLDNVSIDMSAIDGIGDQVTSAVSSIDLSSATAGITDNLADSLSLNTLGSNIIDGLGNAITDNVPVIGEAFEDLKNFSWERLQAAFETHSPSRMTYRIGTYVMQGLELGVTDNIEATAEVMYDSCMTIGEALTEGLAAGINGGQQVVLDATNSLVSNVMSSLGSLITFIGIASAYNGTGSVSPVREFSATVPSITSGGAALSDSSTLSAATKMAVQTAKLISETSSTTGGATETVIYNTTTNNQTFNQNNTSPQALSTADIYRQTKNLFATTKSKVGVV